MPPLASLNNYAKTTKARLQTASEKCNQEIYNEGATATSKLHQSKRILKGL